MWSGLVLKVSWICYRQDILIFNIHAYILDIDHRQSLDLFTVVQNVNVLSFYFFCLNEKYNNREGVVYILV